MSRTLLLNDEKVRPPRFEAMWKKRRRLRAEMKCDICGVKISKGYLCDICYWWLREADR